jgi:hypothetical protein
MPSFKSPPGCSFPQASFWPREGKLFKDFSGSPAQFVKQFLPQRRKDAKRCRVSEWLSLRLCAFAGEIVLFFVDPGNGN